MSLNSTTTTNPVKFVHFNGKLSEWNFYITNPQKYHFENAIVFAKVWTSFDSYSMKIYAGIDGHNEPHIFDIPDVEDITEIKAMLHRDEAGNFTSGDMTKAIEMYLSRSYDSPDTILNKIKTDILNLQSAVKWNVIEEDLY